MAIIDMNSITEKIRLVLAEKGARGVEWCPDGTMLSEVERDPERDIYIWTLSRANEYGKFGITAQALRETKGNEKEILRRLQPEIDGCLETIAYNLRNSK